MILCSMVRGGKACAQVVVLGNGKCVVAWPTSTIVYDSLEAAVAVHIEHMASRGEPTRFEVAAVTRGAERGLLCCAMDANENAPFGSTGGLKQRHDLQIPDYIPEAERAEWLLGYQTQAALMWGSDWRTCEFGWRPSIAIADAP